MSPEDSSQQRYKLPSSTSSDMMVSRHLDEFNDVVFSLKDSIVKANSVVLSKRSEYFRSMLAHNSKFKELKQKSSGVIRVENIEKAMFYPLMQYLYCDSFYITEESWYFYVRFLIVADFFLLPRLVDICSKHLQPYVNRDNVLKILLLAHAHNATQLQRYCINFIGSNYEEILEKSDEWDRICLKAQTSLTKYIQEEALKEREENYVHI